MGRKLSREGSRRLPLSRNISSIFPFCPAPLSQGLQWDHGNWFQVLLRPLTLISIIHTLSRPAEAKTSTRNQSQTLIPRQERRHRRLHRRKSTTAQA